MAETPLPASPQASPAASLVQYDDFTKLELRVATVVECKTHPNADKLLVLQIDLGGERRQICAGLRQHYAPEQLVGSRSSSSPTSPAADARGSKPGNAPGRTDAAGGKVIVVSPSEPAAAGSKVS